MKIKDYSFTKSFSKTQAYKRDGLTNYQKVEASETRTIENPTEQDIKELKQEVHRSVHNSCSFDPKFLTDYMQKEFTPDVTTKTGEKGPGMGQSKSKVKKGV